MITNSINFQVFLVNKFGFSTAHQEVLTHVYLQTTADSLQYTNAFGKKV
jgi:hypothetical protein